MKTEIQNIKHVTMILSEEEREVLERANEILASLQEKVEIEMGNQTRYSMITLMDCFESKSNFEDAIRTIEEIADSRGIINFTTAVGTALPL